MAGQRIHFPGRSEKTLFILSAIWISGYFLLPSEKIHLQLFHLAFTLPGAWLLLKNRFDTEIQPSAILFASAAYAAYYIVSLAWTTPEGTAGRLGEVKEVMYLFLFWISLNHWMKASPEGTALLAKMVAAAALLSIGINGALFYGVDGFGLADRFAGIGRLWNPLWSGAAYGACAVLMFGVLNWRNSALQRSEKILYGLFFLIFAAATILTHSRGPAGAMLAACSAILLTTRLAMKKKASILAAAAILLLALLYLLDDYFGASIERGQSYRLDLWQGFIERATEHPMFGFGAGARVPIHAPGEFVDGWMHYHSVYVGSLVELGLAGLLLHLCLCFAVIRTGWRHRHELHARIALVLFIYTMIIGLTFGQGIITRQNVQWLLFWLPAIILASFPRTGPAHSPPAAGGENPRR